MIHLLSIRSHHLLLIALVFGHCLAKALEGILISSKLKLTLHVQVVLLKLCLLVQIHDHLVLVKLETSCRPLVGIVALAWVEALEHILRRLIEVENAADWSRLCCLRSFSEVQPLVHLGVQLLLNVMHLAFVNSVEDALVQTKALVLSQLFIVQVVSDLLGALLLGIGLLEFGLRRAD